MTTNARHLKLLLNTHFMNNNNKELFTSVINIVSTNNNNKIFNLYSGKLKATSLC